MEERKVREGGRKNESNKSEGRMERRDKGREGEKEGKGE